jgi:hypothetical protein
MSHYPLEIYLEKTTNKQTTELENHLKIHVSKMFILECDNRVCSIFFLFIYQSRTANVVTYVVSAIIYQFYSLFIQC